MIDTVFIDLDGIIVNMVGHIIKKLNLNEKEIFDKWVRGYYDMFPVLGMSKDEVFDLMDEAFWLTAKLTFEADEVIKLCRKRFGELSPLVFLSAPIDRRNCVDAKLRWAHKHYPEIPCFVGSPKFHMAGPNKLLIDDCDQNVSQFIEYGGNAILFPRLWNSEHPNMDRGLEVLKERLYKL